MHLERSSYKSSFELYIDGGESNFNDFKLKIQKNKKENI